MKLIIFDGNSILNRAFYGVKPLINSRGLHTNGIYGFINILFKFLDEEKPDYICCAFDLKAATFRHKKFKGYKAQRKGMPNELAEQLEPLKNVIDALKIPRLAIEGYEADDILGTLSVMCKDSGTECVIVTGDRDSLQLVDDLVTVKLAHTRGGSSETVIYNKKAILEKYKIEPLQLIDVKGFMGDTSDNIPGVAGVGKKTALDLIQRFSSMENIYKNLDNLPIKDKLKEKLRKDRDMALLSYELSEICKDVPVNIEIEDLKQGEPNKEALYELFTELGFSSFLSRFDLINDKMESEPEIELKRAELEQLLHLLKESSNLYFLSEDGSADYLYILLGEDIYYISKDDYSADNYNAFLKEIFENPEIKKYTHNVKPICISLLKKGIELNGLEFDSMLAGYVLNPSQSTYDLSAMAKEYCNKAYSTIPLLLSSLPCIIDGLKSKIHENGQEKLLYDIEQPLSIVLSSMEHIGFKVKREALVEFGEELDDRIKILVENIYREAGKSFNINSPKQLGEVLFGDLGLPVISKTKTGYSTSAAVLQKLRGYHEIIDYILEYRLLAKLKSTYVDGLLKVIDDSDGRIHTSFNQTVTQTGRISSTEPNLQNIPVKQDIGRNLRKMFVAKSNDYCLIDADYSQIELRVLSHIANDENMISAFLNGEDIHTKTASKVFGVEPEEVTPLMRSRAKAVNFGIVYGISDFSLAQDIKVSRKEARKYIDEYLNTYSGVKNYMSEIVTQAKKNGYVTTLFARRRYIPELFTGNKNTRNFGERVAMNTPVQGTAADIIKIAMVRVYNRLQKSGYKSKLILQVHDELIVEAPKTEAAEVAAILKEEMENAAALRVPLTADTSVGDSWYDAKS